MKIKQPTGLEYTNGADEYWKFQHDRISPMVEVFHILPDGSEALNLVPKSKLKALFANLKRIKEMNVNDRPLMTINGDEYRINKSYGLATNVSSGNHYISIYLEDLNGKAYEYLWFPDWGEM